MPDSYARLRTVLNLFVFSVLSLGTAAVVMRARPGQDDDPGVAATLNGKPYLMRLATPTAHWNEFESGMNVEGQIEIDFPAGGAPGPIGPGLSLFLSPNLTAGEIGFASYRGDGVEVRYMPVFGHDNAHARLLVFTTEGEGGEGVLTLDTIEPRPGGVVAGTLKRATLRGAFEAADLGEPEGDEPGAGEEPERILVLEDVSFTTTIERP